MPHSFELERALLGGLLFKPEQLAWMDVQEEDFHDPRHRVVLAAMLALYADKVAIDEVTLEAQLRLERRFEAIGGWAFLTPIVTKLPTTDNAEHYAEVLRRRRIERDLLWQMGKASAEIYAGQAPAEGAELVDEVIGELGRIETGKKRQRRTLFDAVIAEARRVLAPERESPGLPTGIPGLDAKTGGVPRGTTLVVGGRPGGGKSALVGIQIAITIAELVGPVLVGTWEDRDKTLGRRGVSRFTGVEGKRLRAGDLDLQERARVAELLERQAPEVLKRIFIEHMHGQPIDQFARLARSYIRGEGVVCIVGDYLQRIPPPRYMRGADTNKVREAVVNAWDELIGAEDVGGVLLSQLTRECVREGRAPRADDLRDSGAIEQVAKQIWLVHETPRSGDWILVRKDSGGEVGKVPVIFDRVNMTFRDRPVEVGGLHDDD
jgi:replicative DNA helicase